jgi:hypothetical protein
MANTYSSSLVTQMLSDGFISTAQNRLAPFSAVSRNFGVDPMKPLAVVQVPLATSGATTQTNPTTFGGGNSTVTNVQVTLAHYHQPFHVSHTDLQNGMRLAQIIDVNVGKFCDKLVDIFLAPVTVANFTNTPVTAASASFDIDDIRTLYNSIKTANVKSIILDSDYYARFAIQNDTQNRGVSVTGWGNFYENTRWTGAGSNVKGFAFGMDSIAIAAGSTIVGPGASDAGVKETPITLPGIGLTVQAFQWFDPATRNLNASFDVMFGSAAGDTTVGTIVKSA